MLHEYTISSIISKETFDKLINDRYIEETYDYHCIIVKYQDNTDILTMKIDKVEDLIKLKDLNIISKHYVRKIHYYNDSDNVIYDEGEECHIENLGYFFLNGMVELSDKGKEKVKEMFDNYDKEYTNMTFEFTDEEFLSLNKPIIYC